MATIKIHKAEPTDPPIEKVVLELTRDEAVGLALLIGQVDGPTIKSYREHYLSRAFGLKFSVVDISQLNASLTQRLYERLYPVLQDAAKRNR